VQRWVWLGLMVTGCAGRADLSGDGCTERTFYEDRDGDGYGVDPVVACEQPAGTAREGDDCDDVDAEQYPGATERCNGEDDDCDGQLHPDERDQDEDGVRFCRDCDDLDPQALPGAIERCNDKDDDCDGIVDEPDDEGTAWYPDDDEDGYGDPEREVLACFAPDGHIAAAGDCDDGDAAINPDAFERCDDIDHNCDGGVWGWRVSDGGALERAILAASAGDTVCVEPGRYEIEAVAHAPVRIEGVGDRDAVIIEATRGGWGAAITLGQPADVSESGAHEIANLTLRGQKFAELVLAAVPEAHPLHLDGVRLTSEWWACPGVRDLRGSWTSVELDTFECAVGFDLTAVAVDGLDVHDGAFEWRDSSRTYGLRFLDVQGLRIERVMAFNVTDAGMPELVRARRAADVVVKDLIVHGGEADGPTADPILVADELSAVSMSRLDVDVGWSRGTLVRADRIADLTLRDVDVRADALAGLIAPHTSASVDLLGADMRRVRVAAREGSAPLIAGSGRVSVRNIVLADTAFEGNFSSLIHGGDGTALSFATWRNVDFQPAERGTLLHGPCTIDHLDLSASDLFATDPCTTTWSNAFDVEGIELGWAAAEPRYRDVSSDDPSDWDLRPAADSPLVDAGDPAEADADGSRADVSAYGGR